MSDVLDVLATRGTNGRLDATSPAAGAPGAIADDVNRLDAQQVMVVAEPDGADLDVVRHR